jgi:hypothetical protein
MAKEEPSSPTGRGMFHHIDSGNPFTFGQLVCALILVLGRFVNFALPLTFGRLVTIFEQYASGGSLPRPNPWPVLGFYVVLRFLQSSGGLAALRDVSHPISPIHRLLTTPLVVFMGAGDAVFRPRDVATYFQPSSQFIALFPHET